MSQNSGQLYIVATPIGNQGDISPRAVQVLQSVDKIAAEDTRHSGQFLRLLNINTHCVALHEHNERHFAETLITAIENGENIALISDAGTPLVSDPGYHLVKLAHQHNIKVTPIPGPSAVITALSASGLPTSSFCFEGFIPAKSGQRRQFFEQRKKEYRTLIFYETPHRIVASLNDMLDIFGANRIAVMARELTKTFETIKYAPLQQLLDFVSNDSNQQKGEIVIMLQGFSQEKTEIVSAETDAMLKVLLAELPLKQAVMLAASISGEKRKKLYQHALTLKQADE